MDPPCPPLSSPRKTCTPRCGSATSSAVRGDGVAMASPSSTPRLPGGGWPRRALTELLPQPGIGEIRSLAPGPPPRSAMVRLVMLFDPPAQLGSGAGAARAGRGATAGGADTARQRRPRQALGLRAGAQERLRVRCSLGSPLAPRASAPPAAGRAGARRRRLRDARSGRRRVRAPRRCAFRCAPPAPDALALRVNSSAAARRAKHPSCWRCHRQCSEAAWSAPAPERTEPRSACRRPGGHLHRSRLTLVEPSRHVLIALHLSLAVAGGLRRHAGAGRGQLRLR